MTITAERGTGPLPAEQREQVRDLVDRHGEQRAAESVSMVGYEGWLPLPEILARYEEIVPGSAGRMVDAFEKEGDHRRKIENDHAVLADGAIRHELTDRRVGLWFGFFIAIGGLALAAFAIVKGHAAAGSIIGVGDIAGLATVFVTGRTIRSRIS